MERAQLLHIISTTAVSAAVRTLTRFRQNNAAHQSIVVGSYWHDMNEQKSDLRISVVEHRKYDPKLGSTPSFLACRGAQNSKTILPLHVQSTSYQVYPYVKSESVNWECTGDRRIATIRMIPSLAGICQASRTCVRTCSPPELSGNAATIQQQVHVKTRVYEYTRYRLP